MITSNLLNFLYVSFRKIFENRKKSVYFEKFKKLSSHIQRQENQPPESTLIDSNGRIEIFKVLEFFSHLSVLKISEKIIKNVVSRQLQGFEQSYLVAKFATLESTLTEPHYRGDNFKFCEFLFFEFFLKNLKNPKNVRSRQLQGFGQSNLQARSAVSKCTQKTPRFNT